LVQVNNGRTNIGVIGGGIAGLQLALYLQNEGIAVTLYTERTAEQTREGRFPGIVIRHAPTRARERQLGINFWDMTARNIDSVRVRIGGPEPIDIEGRLSEKGSIVDMRLYLSTLQEEFGRRGGKVMLTSLEESLLPMLSERHSLLVVASGRASLTGLFPRLSEYSPFDRPQRKLFSCVADGVHTAHADQVTFSITPGAGEIFDAPLYSFDGNGAALHLEAVPDGPIAELLDISFAAEPDRFQSELLRILREFAPLTYARVTPDFFRITRPLDTAYGAITPVFRQGYVRLSNGRYVLTLGDLHVVNDPVLGQGANAASYAAFVVGEAIREADTFGEAFCQEVEARRGAYLRAATAWTNAMLQPPPPHVIGLMVEACRNPALADAFVSLFLDPIRAWGIFSDPLRTEVFIGQYTHIPAVAAV
jgi:2-polyprenyl-6-methoxyphenol hydroxylase-like FAD-dependent oxidoreductase